MKTNKTLITAGAAFLLTLALALKTHAYGSDGHESVGAIADDLLQGTKAEAHVKQLLNNDTLQIAATWADRAKKPTDQEMKDYVHANHDHHGYHFTDIPIQESHYSDTSIGASTNDIVHIMVECINVLQGNDTPQANPHAFSPRTALMLLAHFTGDIHQPLHVGAAYLNSKNRFANPNTAAGTLEPDEGGNFLKYKSTVLHAYWDDNTVARAFSKHGAKNPAAYAAAVLQNSPVIARPSGPVTSWPQQWADEILPLAAQAHRGMKISKPQVVTDFFGTHKQWTVKTPSGYEDWARDTVDERLTTGGHRLALLLQAIWPEH